jgi:uncharacterized SAM-binding protein YcdF (DUF218 family)
MGFILKKVISRLLFPLPLGLELLVIGLLLSRSASGARSRRWGRRLIVAGTVWIFLLSSYPVANRLLGPLEQHFPPFGERQLLALAKLPVRSDAVQIGVMGHGFGANTQLPPLQRIDTELSDRLDEAIRVWRLLDAAGIEAHMQVSMSGRAPVDQLEAGLAAYLRHVGLPADQVAPHFGLLDSRQEILAFQQHLPTPTTPLILVSSASHIPRCIQLGRALGLDPIPAPARPWIRDTEQGTADMWFPNAEAMRRSERAVYAYIGILWTWLTEG